VVQALSLALSPANRAFESSPIPAAHSYPPEAPQIGFVPHAVGPSLLAGVFRASAAIRATSRGPQLASFREIWQARTGRQLASFRTIPQTSPIGFVSHNLASENQPQLASFRTIRQTRTSPQLASFRKIRRLWPAPSGGRGCATQSSDVRHQSGAR
jgi:hypothetical protein